MAPSNLGDFIEKGFEVEAKIIVTTSGLSKIKMLLTKNLKGELDFINRHFEIQKGKDIDKEIKYKTERVVYEYINPKKNKILAVDYTRINKGNINKAIIDCYVTVETDKGNSDKDEKFLSLEDITKSNNVKSLAVLNTLVYFQEQKKKK
jgi:hypothetical protein